MGLKAYNVDIQVVKAHVISRLQLLLLLPEGTGWPLLVALPKLLPVYIACTEHHSPGLVREDSVREDSVREDGPRENSVREDSVREEDSVKESLQQVAQHGLWVERLETGYA